MTAAVLQFRRADPERRPSAEPVEVRPEGWAEALGAYVTYMRAAGRSPGTIRLHQHYLTRLSRLAADPWQVTRAALMQSLGVPAWKPETRKSCRSVLVTFYAWATDAGWLDHSPAARLPRISVPTRTARPAPAEALRIGLEHARPDVRLMLLFAAYAGLRCVEVAAVHHDDLSDGLLYVTGKGGKRRMVPLEHLVLVEAITNCTGYLFPSPIHAREHITAGHVTRKMSEALPDGWTGHTLRHRFATRAYAGTRDLLAVGVLLGHSRPETTQRYVRLPSDALLAGVRAAADMLEAGAR